MPFPTIPDDLRLGRLQPSSGRVRMVLDTDTYNEIDDQFAVVYSLLSPERLDVEAIYAAPFFNSRSTGAGDGMEKSYEEILRLLERLDTSPKDFVFRGSTSFLPEPGKPVESDAALHLIERAMASKDAPLYVVAIGAITNVASAILMQPAIIERIVVVWLGGEPLYWPNTRVFNVAQDVPAAQVIFNSGVPLVHIPCFCVASHLLTTLAELECHVKGRGAIGDYLVEIFKDYSDDHYAYAKEIWDISAIAYLINPDWVPTELVHSPILTDQVTWSEDHARHLIRNATFVRRNAVFRDLFKKIEARA